MEELRELKLQKLFRSLLLRDETCLLGGILKEGSPAWIEAKLQLLSCSDVIQNILDIKYKIQE